MDRLVAEGIRLTRHYVHPECTPSRVSFQTGRTPPHSGQSGLCSPSSLSCGIPYNATTISTKLARAGYRTAFVGKWDCGAATPHHTPFGRNYSTALNYFGHGNYQWGEQEWNGCVPHWHVLAVAPALSRIWRHMHHCSSSVTRWFRPYIESFCGGGRHQTDFWLNDRPAYELANRSATELVYEEVIFGEQLRSIVEGHDASPGAPPLFLTYAARIAHYPIQAPVGYQRLPHIAAIDVPHRLVYHAQVQFLDDQLGNLTATYRARGLWNTTLMVLHADNGGYTRSLGPCSAAPDSGIMCTSGEAGANNFPFRGGKYSFFEGGIRANSFVSGGLLPARVRGTDLAELMHVSDWYATYTSLAGADPRDAEGEAAGVPPVDGLDMTALLMGTNGTSPRTEIYIGPVLIIGDWKLVTGSVRMASWAGPTYPNSTSDGNTLDHYTAECQQGCLYDLSSDESEHVDLAASDPDRVAGMLARLNAYANTIYPSASKWTGYNASCIGSQEASTKLWGGFIGPFCEVAGIPPGPPPPRPPAPGPTPDPPHYDPTNLTNCTYLQNTWIEPLSGTRTDPNATTEAECCTACGLDPTCVAAVLKCPAPAKLTRHAKNRASSSGCVCNLKPWNPQNALVHTPSKGHTSLACITGRQNITTSVRTALPPPPISQPRSHDRYIETAGTYCVGNVHPNASVYVGMDSVVECRLKCLAAGEGSGCACYDTTSQQGQMQCRITLFSEATAPSKKNYTSHHRVPGPPPPATVQLDFSPGSGSPFKHFWESTGWCPPDPHPRFPSYFTTENIHQNHHLIAGVPRHGIKQVRIHFLLDLIKLAPASVFRGSAGGDGGENNLQPAIVFPGSNARFWRKRGLNFTALDSALDQLVGLGLAPGFELMGNPGNLDDRSDRLFTSFQDHGQILAFGELVELVASRYIARYGLEVVRSWRFESWNEPDGEVHHDLDAGIECDMLGFFAYFDACAAALRRVDTELIFGGPASDGAGTFLFGLVEHCIHGHNTVTNRTGCDRVDFLNIHKKGNQSTAAITNNELPFAQAVIKKIAGTPLETARWGNDEADPKVHWSSLYLWQADARYAAMVPKVIAQHQEVFIDGQHIKYDVLSNDNGFLPYPDNGLSTFQQRTLIAQWSYNSSGTVASVRKPVLNAMAMLALLGETIHKHAGLGSAMTSEIGVIPTVTPDGTLSVLVWASADSDPINPFSPPTRLTLQFLTRAVRVKESGATEYHRRGSTPMMAMGWAIDENRSNAHTAYMRMGSPKFPSASQLATLRAAAELVPIWPEPFPINASSSGRVSVDLELSIPSVTLVMLCPDYGVPPSQVSNLQIRQSVPRKTERHTKPVFSEAEPIISEIMLSWTSVPEYCVATYKVYGAPNDGAAPSRGREWGEVADGTIFTSYTLAVQSGSNLSSPSCFAVSAIDAFGREGPKSREACI